jgi:hypothetical protein
MKQNSVYDEGISIPIAVSNVESSKMILACCITTGPLCVGARLDMALNDFGVAGIEYARIIG